MGTRNHENIPNIEEKMWTRVPCFYTENKSIVIRVFGDHINFIADTVIQYKDELSEYKITHTVEAVQKAWRESNG